MFLPALVLLGILFTPLQASAAGVSASQVVLHQADVPANVLIKAETHAIPGYGSCSDAYQSVFGSGMGGSEAIFSIAYQCPSATEAAGAFASFALFYRQYYDHPAWHFRILPAVHAGHQYLAWYNRGVPGAKSTGGQPLQGSMITLVFQRKNFLAFLQLTYMGETLAAAEGSADRLGYLMDHHIGHGGN